MGIEFARSARSTIGIEWEIALVDRTTGDLVCIADEVLEALRGPDGSPHPHITGELLLNTVELVSGVHTTVAGAVADVYGQVDEVRAITDPRGVDLICSGSHPFGQWFDQEVTDKERYHKLIDRTQWWGRNMMIWGIHVHVGIEDRDKVIPILNGLLGYLPHLQALSASSPFWAGIETGYASNRAQMFQQLPTAGLPWILEDWASWEQYVEDMTRTGIIDDMTEVRWDIRPSARWGTIEIRACDGVSTATELGAIAALIQCLVEWMSTEIDAGRPVPSMQPWFVRENKWRASRYGLDAEIILDSSGAERLVTDDVRRLIGVLSPTAERLGCLPELLQLNGILDAGASYQRQLRVAAANGGSLPAVVAALSAELRGGTLPV
ncbi:MULTISPECIES: glutamate--cysteine ligase [unclassified Cryobacterium]|uniref:glutamate--cysteine ligase n=1 Tax=unclassified Cryobacterium TaxID=2649013 RepID=UPI002AB59585|nr:MULTISPECIES: glutamate--cysteine ligase [unclassified Cryobacterium]MDY7544272.1 glutamate--cysteine ligase [Cryobacterium sp. 5B3]MEA9997860.1 glutamate--cysteine ligase [Cryobacterium sp. RTS3]MEB0264638.1 glutamate--cysteine ligase [Cryobacterium sp. 10I5]MEB0273871.1 glutamate--cysteine ligase [Cryobacterium sp. 5B3]